MDARPTPLLKEAVRYGTLAVVASFALAMILLGPWGRPPGGGKAPMEDQRLERRGKWDFAHFVVAGLAPAALVYGLTMPVGGAIALTAVAFVVREYAQSPRKKRNPFYKFAWCGEGCMRDLAFAAGGLVVFIFAHGFLTY